MRPAVVLATLRDTPVLPTWLAATLALPTMVIVAAHLIAMHRSGRAMPESRRRLRIANGGLMLVAVPVIAIAFGVVTPADHRMFMSVWLLAMWLLGVIVVLAGIDAANTARLAARERAKLRRQIRRLREQNRAAPPDADASEP